MRIASDPGTVHGLFLSRVDTTPDAVACCHRTSASWVPTTWRELAAQVRRVAAGFRRAGVAKGDRLAVQGRTSREWLLAELAAYSLGAVVVGIDSHASGGQAKFVLDHSEARFLVADDTKNLERIPSEVRDRLTGVFVPDTRRGNEIRWQFAADDLAADENPTPVSPVDPATLVYTAGTTGTSKGIRYTHRHLLAACDSIMRMWPELGPGDSTLCWLPMAHQFQRMLNLWAVACGMTMYFVEDPRTVADALRQVRPSFFVAVPRFYEKFAQGLRAAPDPAAAAREATGGNIRFMLTGSAPLAPWVGEYLHGLGLLVLEAYGVTENTVPLVANRTDAYRFGSVGRPFPGNELRLAEDGEVLVRGPGLFDGYDKDEQRPPHLFTPDGFYRTGDLGRVDADGFWYLVGRKAEMIKTSTGRRISPTAVEGAYSQGRLLDQVVVFGHGRTHLVALVTLKPAAVVAELGLDPSSTGEQLANSPAVREGIRAEMEHLGRTLPPYEQVRHFDILPAPLSVERGELTPTLKLRRREIAARHADRIERLYQEPSPQGAAG